VVRIAARSIGRKALSLTSAPSLLGKAPRSGLSGRPAQVGLSSLTVYRNQTHAAATAQQSVPWLDYVPGLPVHRRSRPRAHKMSQWSKPSTCIMSSTTAAASRSTSSAFLVQ
jgi:hypothetical protein